MKRFLYTLLAAILCTAAADAGQRKIDRLALVSRNNPHITGIDSLASLSTGNGEFAFTADITGLQTFPDFYKNGVPLGTQSQWGWHSFPNRQGFIQEETLMEYDFGRGRKELYAGQPKEKGRSQEASEWFRSNPHRLHLGTAGFDFDRQTAMDDITDIDQTLDLWQGILNSSFRYKGTKFTVKTACHPEKDMVSAEITSKAHAGICFRFPYPTGMHCDDACDWNADDRHSTEVMIYKSNSAVLKRVIDSTVYYVTITWNGNAELTRKLENYFVLLPHDDKFSFTCTFSPEPMVPETICFDDVRKASSDHWKAFWTDGAAVDFSSCTDPRAGELERRVVLSQYLLAIQCAGSTPPQETGLTYNSWFGKFHLEMIWWHQSQFALWNRTELLARTLGWYRKVLPKAREIARRQGFDGVRWMKMTDPEGTEAPSKVGSFLIWQQPHIIYLAELLYRNAVDKRKILDAYGDMIMQTAEFMCSFATLDSVNNRYILKGLIPAQETLKADETVNPPFELSYWHYALQVAQSWRERLGMPREKGWDDIISRLSPLAYNEDRLYLAAENAAGTYRDIRFTSDHMAVLGAVGILPLSRLADEECMRNTLHWVWDNWNWDKTWGWDYPMTAMNAARLGEPEKAVGALLMNKRTNTYLPNGHNLQDKRLRVYLPGNGGLLTAIAMMCAGWDGCAEKTPGFPKDGKWNVRWEGLRPMP
ncbi:MAG: hypothetical protein NC344_01605 [Bacteroidales bacterium]|nr:hypothetical protein [Bacteroidales bacterium]MCM1146530.1 hypothetical protein [Bacteroidales bacterium]MCM1205922.1 hypothetical protein [Bacillota bacterium]MCM1510200.1 glycoside hydrolase family 65 [Clostridium sp.]